MSVFKRAEWHSGLTYRQTCRECNEVVVYTDHKLGFRPWYPDGFVYCPKCETPLRHNEEYAIDGPEKQEIITVEAEEPEIVKEDTPVVESEPQEEQPPVAETEATPSVPEPIRLVIEDADRTVVLTEIPLRPVAVEVEAAPVEEPEQPAAPQEQPAEKEEQLSAFCHQCGKKFLEDDRFCSGCGTKRR